MQQWFGACYGDTDAISEVIEEMKATFEDIVLERFQDIYGSICFDSNTLRMNTRMMNLTVTMRTSWKTE